MNTKNITKVVVAVALTLSVVLGGGFVGDAIGLQDAPAAMAGVKGAGSGGGC